MKKIILLIFITFSFQISFGQTTKDEFRKRRHQHHSLKSMDIGNSETNNYLLNKKANKQKLDNIIGQTNFTGTGFINSDKDEFTYDPNGWEITHLYNIWDEAKSQWIKESKYDYIRDSKGNCTSLVTLGWNANLSKFENYEKEVNKFDSKNNLILKLFYLWDTDVLGWVNVNVTDNRYNANNQIISVTDSNFLDVFSINRKDYTYDVKGNNTLEVYTKWNFTLLKFENIKKVENTFDNNNRKTKTVWTFWDNNLKVWLNSIYFDYTYNSNGRELSRLDFTWDNTSSSFINTQKVFHTYDLKENLTSSVFSEWDDEEEIWINTYKKASVFDISIPVDQLVWPFNGEGHKSKLTQELEYNWNEVSSAWENDFKSTFNYSPFGSATINEIYNSSAITLFPNPANDKVFISIPNYSGNFEVKLMDLSGKILKVNEISNNGYLEVSEATKGIYLIQIYNDSNLLGVRKLVIN